MSSVLGTQNYYLLQTSMQSFLRFIRDLRDRVWTQSDPGFSNLPVFELGAALDEDCQIPIIAEEGEEPVIDRDTCENVPGAYYLRFKIREGYVILTLWNELVHGVTYQTPLRKKSLSLQRNKFLFEAYFREKEWCDTPDSGYGKLFKTLDRTVYGLWSHVDFISFCTGEWQEAEHGRRW